MVSDETQRVGEKLDRQTANIRYGLRGQASDYGLHFKTLGKSLKKNRTNRHRFALLKDPSFELKRMNLRRTRMDVG